MRGGCGSRRRPSSSEGWGGRRRSGFRGHRGPARGALLGRVGRLSGMQMEILACALLLPAVSGGPSRRWPTDATRSAGTSSRVRQRQLWVPDVRRADTGPDTSTRTPHQCPHRAAHVYRAVAGRTCRSQSARTPGPHHRQGHPSPTTSRTGRSGGGACPVFGRGRARRRRGRSYATILVDMNNRRLVDVLVARTARTFAAWLREHPEVRGVSRRDRAGSFHDGAQAGAPQARQGLAGFRHVRCVRGEPAVVDRARAVARTRERRQQIRGSRPGGGRRRARRRGSAGAQPEPAVGRMPGPRFG